MKKCKDQRLVSYSRETPGLDFGLVEAGSTVVGGEEVE